MHKKSKAEMERAKITKATKMLVRLKHSLAADEEINDVLPDRLEDFDAALQVGVIKRLTTSLDDVL